MVTLTNEEVKIAISTAYLKEPGGHQGIISPRDLSIAFEVIKAMNAKSQQASQNHAAEPAKLTELQKDAPNLLFALHDAWPYVHQWCTIQSKKSSILQLIRKHGEFVDFHKTPVESKSEEVADDSGPSI
jgi:hypothetical protein